MNKRIPPDWAAIRADYLANELSLDQICQRHDISLSSLSRAKIRFGWSGRNAPRRSSPLAGGSVANRKILISRLFLVLEKQVEHMETKITQDADDREIALLGHLVRNLEKLVELDRKQDETGPEKTRPASREMQQLRKKLSQRLNQLERE